MPWKTSLLASSGKTAVTFEQMCYIVNFMIVSIFSFRVGLGHYPRNLEGGGWYWVGHTDRQTDKHMNRRILRLIDLIGLGAKSVKIYS